MRLGAAITLVVLLALAAVLAFRWVRPEPPPSPTVDRAAPVASEAPEPPAVDPLEPGTEAEPPPVAADVPWTLDVTVVDPEGAPVPESVVFFRNDEGWNLAEGRTDGAGSVTLEVRGSGHMVIERTKDHLPACVEGLAPPDSGRSQVTVRLPRGLAIAGRVVAQDGIRPAPRAAIRVRRMEVPLWESPFVASYGPAGEDGRFRAEGLPAGRYRLEVRPRSEDHGARPEPAPEFVAGDEDVVVRLAPLATVTVRLREVAPGPERRITTIHIEDDAGWKSNNAKSGGDQDTFTLSLRPGRKVRLTVEVPGWIQVRPVEVDLRPEDRTREVTIEIRPDDRPKARLRISIRTDSGVVPDDVRIAWRISSGITTTDVHELTEGAVTLDIPAGRQELTVAPHFLRAELSDPWMPVPLELDLEPGGTLETSVVLVTGGWIRVRGPNLWRMRTRVGREGEPLEAVPHRRAPDRDGHLLGKTCLSPGTWILEIRPHRRPPQRHVVEVRPGEIAEVDYR